MAGAGYKLFTTGQVLTAAEVNTYLQEQVIMVFNDATARTTALSGVLAEGMVSYLKSTKVVEIYNGTAWASLDDPNAIQNTIVDAKGDLISASGNDVPARLAVGNNGETLVADSSATTGLRWQGTPSASNPLINSAFDVWQRGTSFAVPLNYTSYTADRYMAFRGGLNSGATISRQSTNDTSNLPFIRYCLRYQRDAGNTATGDMNLLSTMETTDSIRYAGRTITFSFYARAGANYSATSSLLQVRLDSGTGTDQNITSGFTGQSSIVSSNATLSTSWQRFTFTGTVAASATQIGFYVFETPTGTAGANDWYEITGFQIDLGSVALPYRRYSATLAGELAACQRYYYRNTATDNYTGFLFGSATNTTRVDFIAQFPVPMRVKPTAVDSGNVSVNDFAGNNFTITSFNFGYGGNTSAAVYTSGSTGLTAYRPYFLLANNNTSAYIAFNAEL